MKTRFKILMLAAAGLAIPALVQADGTELWKKHCAMCHGVDGTGHTMMGKRLGLKDYTDPAVQAKMTDEEIAKFTKEGVKNDAGKQVMKPFAGKLSDDEVTELVAHIRSFKKG